MKPYVFIFLITVTSLFMSCAENTKKTQDMSIENTEKTQGVSTENIEKIQVVPTEVYKELVKEGNHTLIDVRTPEEFADGTLNGAVNIDFFDTDNFYETYDKYDRKEPIYLFCRTGSRSINTAYKLEEMGFEKIYDMEGGYMQWQKDQE